MIVSSDIMPMIVNAAPQFEPELMEFRKSWSDDGPGIYNELNEVVSFLICAYNRGDKQCDRLLVLAERFLTQGDDDVKGITTLGFLETLQNQSSWEPYGSAVFVPSLGPKSKDAWTAIERQWAGSKSLADIIRKETGSTMQSVDASDSSLDIQNIDDPELLKIARGLYRKA